MSFNHSTNLSLSLISISYYLFIFQHFDFEVIVMNLSKRCSKKTKLLILVLPSLYYRIVHGITLRATAHWVVSLVFITKLKF